MLLITQIILKNSIILLLEFKKSFNKNINNLIKYLWNYVGENTNLNDWTMMQWYYSNEEKIEKELEE